jgi:hypothetical protein
MSMWQFGAAIEGWAKQYESADGMPEKDAEEIWQWLKGKDDVPLTFRGQNNGQQSRPKSNGSTPPKGANANGAAVRP